MIESGSLQRHVAVGAAAVFGYHSVMALYRHVREACQSDEPAKESKWVCPGVGVVGGALAAAITCRALRGGGGEAAEASPTPVVSAGPRVPDLSEFLTKAN